MAMEVGNIHIGLYVDVGQTARFNDVASVVEKSSRRMNTALGATHNSVRSLRGQMSQSIRFRVAADSLRDLTKATDEVGRLRAAILGLTALSGAGVTGAFTAAYLVQTADKAKLLGNQIRTVTGDFADYGVIQDKLFDIAQRTRSSLEATTRLYARNARAAEKFGMSQEKLLTITETIQKSFAIGGANPQEAAGAALQLSQGIASDRFGGEEFRSVAENAPVLLGAIAKALKTDIGGLRKMSLEGELTAEVVTKAILASAGEINSAFAKMIPTVAQAFTLVDNAFLRYIGETDNAYGVTEKLSSALIGLADNFDGIFKGVTLAAAALATFYAANKGREFVGGVRAANQQGRDFVDKLVEERDALAAAKTDAKADIAVREFQASSGNFDPAVLAQQDTLNKAKEKEYLTQQRINELQKARGDLVSRLGQAQNAIAVVAQQDLAKARERVRLDQQRVIEAQMAVTAEERILQARREQELTKAGVRVTAANDKVVGANSRIGEAEALIAKERELAKARLAGEVDVRRQSLVTSTQRLKAVQSQIAELRSVKDLGDFDQVYGSQYRKLLEQQQKAITSTKTARDEIARLQTQMASIDAGESATRGITAAMSKHAAAVKHAQSAVEALARAEADRNRVASSDLASKTLQSRVVAEQKALKQYETSVSALQSRMANLKTATVDALGTGPARKLIAEIDKFDSKIVQAQQSLRAATTAVTNAQVGGAAQVAASMKSQAKAQEEINTLQKQATQLADAHAVAVQKIAVAQKRISMLGRVGTNVLGYFGGWTGLGITAALTAATAAMAYFVAESAKAEQQTERINQRLQDMGYLTKAAAENVSTLGDDLKAGRFAKLQAEAADFRKELQKVIASIEEVDISTSGVLSGDAMKPFKFTPGATTGQQEKEFRAWLDANAAAGRKFSDQLTKVRDEMLKTQTMSGDSRKALEDIALAEPSLAAVVLSLVTMGERMNALKEVTDDFVEALQKARDLTSGQDQLLKYATTRTDAANNFQSYATGVQSFGDRVNREGLSTAYESEIKTIMDRLIKDAEKLGQTLLDVDARRIAEQEYANQAAKKGLLDLIGAFEGTDKGRGYNETLAYGKFTGGDVNLTMMTLKEVLELQKKMLAHPDNTYNSSAVGRYQITSETLRDFMGQLGLSGDTIFDQATQDRIAQAIIRSTGGDISALRGRWAGLGRASNEQIQMASAGTFQSLPAYDENTKQWLDGMKDLDLQKQISSLQAFNQEVVKQAMSFGASKEEVEQYIAAISSGDLNAIPEKFRQIAEALRLSDGAFARQMDELRQANVEGLLSDIDQQVISTARSWGVSEEAVRAYVAAIRNSDFDGMPAQLAAIRQELEKASEIKFNKELLSGALDDLRSALDDGKLSWQELGDIALNVLDKIISKLQDQLVDALFATGSATGGGGGGNIFGTLLSGIGAIFGFDDGGWTGPGGKKKPAGVVHADEFVFTKKATQKAGVDNLYRMMDYLETGRLSAIMGAGVPGFEDGGYVGSSSLPNLPSPSMRDWSVPDFIGSNSIPTKKDEVHFTFGWEKGSDGNIAPIIKEVSRKSVMEAAPGIVSASTSQVLPTIAKHQRNKAGGDWRNT